MLHPLPRHDHRDFNWNPLSQNYQGKLDISFPPLCHHPVLHVERITGGKGVLLTVLLVRKSHEETMQIKFVPFLISESDFCTKLKRSAQKEAPTFGCKEPFSPPFSYILDDV